MRLRGAANQEIGGGSVSQPRSASLAGPAIWGGVGQQQFHSPNAESASFLCNGGQGVFRIIKNQGRGLPQNPLPPLLPRLQGGDIQSIGTDH